MVNKKSWEEFRQTGLFWWINSLLHVFGWAIVMEGDYDKETNILNNIKNVYPARVKFRGFDEKSNDEGYKKISQYMKENAEKLLQEVNEE
jgi:hypothetical protein